MKSDPELVVAVLQMKRMLKGRKDFTTTEQVALADLTETLLRASKHTATEPRT